MVRALTIVLLLFLSITADAQTYRYNLKFTVVQRNFVDTIPIEFDNDQLFLPVEVDGQRYRFKLDTGSAMACVYDDSPIRNLREIGRIQSIDATGARQSVKVVGFPTLRIGHRLTLKGYTACVHRRMVRRNREDGIIGFDLFNKGLAAKIDIRRGIMIITDQKHIFQQEYGEVLTYQLRHFTPIVRVSPIVGEEETVLFDTGCREIYAMNKRQFDTYERYYDMSDLVEGRGRGSRAIGHFGAEHHSEIVLLALPRLRLNRFELRDIHCQTFQGHSYLGASLLRYGMMVINPFRKYLLFHPYDHRNYCIVSNPQLEIAIVPTRDGRPCIGIVWERSDAYRQGFRAGDIIEKVDDVQVTDFHSFMRRSYIYDRIYKFTLRDTRGRTKDIHSTMPLLKRR